LVDLFKRSRQYQKRIPFARPFVKPPTVVFGIHQLGLDKAEEINFALKTQALDTRGFDLVIESHSGVRIREILVQWMAFGQRDASDTTHDATEDPSIPNKTDDINAAAD
jgi:hypothetical protein